jgi:hypothetical protein
MVDFNNDEDQASNLKEVKWNDELKMIPQIHLSNLA